jgi:hypothetical protein
MTQSALADNAVAASARSITAKLVFLPPKHPHMVIPW